MKVGDLVTLSAYGRRQQQNHSVKRGFGVVMAVANNRLDKYPITCKWFGGHRDEFPFARRELKFFKQNS